MRVRPAMSVPRLLAGFPWALRRDRADVALFQYVTPPLCPCPAVVAIHDVSFEDHSDWFEPMQRARMRLTTPASARRAAHVITLSQFTRNELIGRYRLDPQRVSVVPLAAAPRFKPDDEEHSRAAVARLTLPRSFVLAVGNLQPRKNLRRLLVAFAKARKAGLEHGLVLAGQPGWRAQELLHTIDALGLREVVMLTGYVSDDELVALYNLADVFAYPSLYEGFGLPIVEAMACGTPVLTSSTTCLPELAGDAALLVDPSDEDALAAGLLRLAGDMALRAQLHKRGLARAASYSWERTARATMALLKDAARADGAS
jgi:glycosyltransferase involved in cell wall biosynthesis